MKRTSYYHEYVSECEALLTECAALPFGREPENDMDPQLFVDPDYAEVMLGLDGPVEIVGDAIVAYDGFGHVLCWTWYDPSSNDASPDATADASYLSRWLYADDDEDDAEEEERVCRLYGGDGYPLTPSDLEWMLEEEEYQSRLRAAKMGLDVA